MEPNHHNTTQGLLGIRTKVELNGVFRTPKQPFGGAAPSGANAGNGQPAAGAGGGGKGLRKDVQFKTARVDFGGFKVTFPHMDIFGVQGWLETTFVDGERRRAACVYVCVGGEGSSTHVCAHPPGSHPLIHHHHQPPNNPPPPTHTHTQQSTSASAGATAAPSSC